MKGLILKDLYMIWNYCKTVVFVCIIFLASSVFVEGSFFFSVYPLVIAGIIPFTIMVYEEKIKWAPYCQSFPITRKQVVTEKYILSLLCILFAAAISVCFAVIRAIINSVDIFAAFSSVISTVTIALTGPIVMLPFIFKYDVEKSRRVYYLVVGGMAGMSTFFSFESRIPDISNGVGITIGAILLVVSWTLSVKFYENKEL